MRVIFSDALWENSHRGVSYSVHSGPPFRARLYVLNGLSATRGRCFSISAYTDSTATIADVLLDLADFYFARGDANVFTWTDSA
jgi:hypothetical protein